MDTQTRDDPGRTTRRGRCACRPPANLSREVSQYDQGAEVGEWSGPRYRMTYRVLGEGPPLIWLPGIASTYRVYCLVLNRLAERFRTIQYDYPGEHAGDGARLVEDQPRPPGRRPLRADRPPASSAGSSWSGSRSARRSP